MKVAIYGKQFQEEVAPFVHELFIELEKAHMEVLVYEPFYNFLSKQITLNLFLGTYNSHEELKENIELFISIGGDGTILDATSAILLNPPKITIDTSSAITIPIDKLRLKDCTKLVLVDR